MPQGTPSKQDNTKREVFRRIWERIVAQLDDEHPSWIWHNDVDLIDDGGGYGVEDDRPEWLKELDNE